MDDKVMFASVQADGNVFHGCRATFSVEVSEEFSPPAEGTAQMRYLDSLFTGVSEDTAVQLEHNDLTAFLADETEKTRCKLYHLSGNIEEVRRFLDACAPQPQNADILLRCFYSDLSALEKGQRIDNAIHHRWTSPDSLVVAGLDFDKELNENQVEIIMLRVTED